MRQTFNSALKKVSEYSESIGINILYNGALDPFFKGDLDGKTIWLSYDLDEEERLFNLLHLLGHTIQWNISEDLYKLGSVLHKKPSEQLIYQLYVYEWEANCYALFVLQYLGFKNLRTWLYDMFKEDINYLIQFYKTGKKKKILPEKRIPSVELNPIPPPIFIPKARKKTRQGIVI